MSAKIKKDLIKDAVWLFDTFIAITFNNRSKLSINLLKFSSLSLFMLSSIKILSCVKAIFIFFKSLLKILDTNSGAKIVFNSSVIFGR